MVTIVTPSTTTKGNGAAGRAQKQPRAGSAALRRAHALRNILIKAFTGVSMIKRRGFGGRRSNVTDAVG